MFRADKGAKRLRKPESEKGWKCKANQKSCSEIVNAEGEETLRKELLVGV
jgi:hypothetical protein